MPCPICNSETTHYEDVGPYIEVICRRCGNFKISDSAVGMVRDNLTHQEIANISSWIRSDNEPLIGLSDIESLKKLPTPTVGEKARRFLIYVSNQHPVPGEFISSVGASDPKYLALTGCYDRNELGYIIRDYLFEDRHYLINLDDSDNRYSFKISPEGWAYIESLKDVNPESRIGFIAMWFDSSMDEPSDIIHKAIRKAGYEPLRIDNKEHNKNINDEIIATIRQSKFVVADFTGQRDGVYYESGYANGLGLEVIWLCEESDFDNVHFDANHNNFIIWNRTDYPALEKKLTDRIIATLGKGPLE